MHNANRGDGESLFFRNRLVFRHGRREERHRNPILWTAPKGPGRNKLIVRTTYDEGRTFTNERLISDEPAAYSDLTVLEDKSVGVLWERGNYRFITFTRLDREFLGPAR